MHSTIDPQTIQVTGITLTLADTTSLEYQFGNWEDGKDVILVIQNDNTMTCSAVLETPWTGHSVANLALADTTVSIAPNTTKYISDFTPELFNRRGDGESLGTRGFVFVTLDGTVGIRIALMKVSE